MSELRSDFQRLIITLHYVRPSQTYHCVIPEEFRTLLDWLQECFAVVTLEELCGSLCEEGRRDKPLCCLTFDDGLQDHYQDLADGEVTEDRVTVAGRVMSMRNNGMFIPQNIQKRRVSCIWGRRGYP